MEKIMTHHLHRCCGVPRPSEPVLILRGRKNRERLGPLVPLVYFTLPNVKRGVIRHQLCLEVGDAPVSSVLSTLNSNQNEKCNGFLLKIFFALSEPQTRIPLRSFQSAVEHFHSVGAQWIAALGASDKSFLVVYELPKKVFCTLQTIQPSRPVQLCSWERMQHAVNNNDHTRRMRHSCTW